MKESRCEYNLLPESLFFLSNHARSTRKWPGKLESSANEEPGGSKFRGMREEREGKGNFIQNKYKKRGAGMKCCSEKRMKE